MKKMIPLMSKRLTCMSLVASAIFTVLPGTAMAQAPLQEVTYLLPAPGTLQSRRAGCEIRRCPWGCGRGQASGGGQCRDRWGHW
jgi:hypothetical protein